MLSCRHDQDKLICAPAHNPEEPDPLGQMRNVLLEFFDSTTNDAQHLFLRCEMAGDMARAVVCCHGFVHGLLSNWLRRPHSFDLAAEGEALVDTLIGMLKNAPALRNAA